MITQDLPRYTRKRGVAASWSVFFSHPGFRFMALHRLCNRYARLHPIGMISRWWYKRMNVKFGFQIPHTTQIGKGFFLGHFGNIVINPAVRIGDNCNIAQGVTIGHVNRGSKTGAPSLGNRVWVGANAVIVGNIHISDDALIAPLTYVNMDVPAKAVVMGNPGKIVSYEGSEGYVNHQVS